MKRTALSRLAVSPCTLPVDAGGVRGARADDSLDRRETKVPRAPITRAPEAPKRLCDEHLPRVHPGCCAVAASRFDRRAADRDVVRKWPDAGPTLARENEER